MNSGEEINLSGNATKWNTKDKQEADKDYIVCYLPEDLYKLSKGGIQIMNNDRCIQFLKKEIGRFEL